MDVLVVEPLEPEVMTWLGERHTVRYAPELARDARALRLSLHDVRALIIPPSVAVDAQTLQAAPMLKALGRLSAGAENIDLDACARAGVEVVRSSTASAVAEAEFMIGAMLQMLRRVPVLNAEGLLVGRELGGATVGLLGMTPSARAAASLLAAFGARVVGYDPSVHASDSLWHRWRIEPLGLKDLFETSDAVCVQLAYYSRYRGLVGERFLPTCKPNQVLVSLTHSSIFDEAALADVLASGRMSAAWIDSLEPGALDPSRPLSGIETLQVTPRVCGTTRESRVRSAWTVVRRVDEVLGFAPASAVAPAAKLTAAPQARSEGAPVAGPTDFPAELPDLRKSLPADLLDLSVVPKTA
jgi:D-3-phosphoglycerate dehydrogenase / 2-oxoglutarate reductase